MSGTTAPDAWDDDERRWAAVAARDRAAAGAFVYAVTTTGVFCRPGCASRRPSRPNVRFFDGAAEAARAGFRACLRCRPEASEAPTRGRTAEVAAACRMIDASDRAPKLAALAASVGLSPRHLHRAFTESVGLTPRAFAAAGREEAGMAENGVGEPVVAAVAPCALGWVLVAATGRGVVAVALGDDTEGLEAGLRARFPGARLDDAADPTLAAHLAAVVARIDDPARAPSAALPLDVRGTAFQRRVWQELQEIPPGEVVTYAGLARRIGRPTAARAVARACASNVLAVVVPCHRVVPGAGGVGGFRWGVERKRRLLERERGEAVSSGEQ